VRNSAVGSLGNFGEQAKDAIPKMLKILKEREPTVRSITAYALGRMKATAAIPLLIEALTDSNRDMRSNAARSLQYMKASAAIPALIKALDDRDLWVRWDVIRAIGSMGEQASIAVPVLLDALQDRERFIRSIAAEALGRIGQPAIAAVTKLEQLLTERDESIQIASAFALCLLPSKSRKIAQDTLLKGLQQRPLFRGTAIYLLGELHKHGAFALPSLHQLLKQKDKDTELLRDEIQSAIKKIQGSLGDR
jgi:HEAT repeat protein